MTDEITTFIAESISLSAKRALAVKMYQKGIKTNLIQEVLGVSSAFVSKWNLSFAEGGTAVFPPKYKGKAGFLSAEQREEVILHLSQQQTYSLQELCTYMKTKYNITYKSQQSYYELLSAGGLSWHKTHKENPKKDESAVAERREEIKKNWTRNEKQLKMVI